MYPCIYPWIYPWIVNPIHRNHRRLCVLPHALFLLGGTTAGYQGEARKLIGWPAAPPLLVGNVDEVCTVTPGSQNAFYNQIGLVDDICAAGCVFS